MVGWSGGRDVGGSRNLIAPGTLIDQESGIVAGLAGGGESQGKVQKRRWLVQETSCNSAMSARISPFD